jgi:hypothetical protein
MRRTTFIATPVAFALGITVTAGMPAEAASRTSRDGYGAVTAHSRYGNPSRTASVRRGRFGPEVDLGNNTWTHCEAGDCGHTLRRQKVDFWETIREEGRGGGRH